MKKMFLAGLVIMLLLGIGNSVQADTITIQYSDDFSIGTTDYSFQVDPAEEWFNSLLGTLNSVKFEIVLNYTIDDSSINNSWGWESRFVAESQDIYSKQQVGMSASGAWGDGTYTKTYEHTITERLNRYLDRTDTYFMFEAYIVDNNPDYDVQVTGNFISNLIFDYAPAATAAPEPTTMLLFGLGILGIAGVSRKRTA